MSNDNSTFQIDGLTFYFQSKRAGFDAQLVSHLVNFIDNTKRTLDCAVYDLRQPDVLSALARVAKSGKQLRIAYHGAELSTAQAIKDFKLQKYATPIHPSGGHLMHHKFAVRDGNALWTGSANFTPGGLQLQDNNCLTAVSADLAKQYKNEFNRLVTPYTFHISSTPTQPVMKGGIKITPYYSSTGGEGLEQVIVNALQGAQRVRVLAFLISDPGILNALSPFKSQSFDIRGVYDPNGMKDALGKKVPDPILYWFLNDPRFIKAPSHPYNPKSGAEQDFMHNKVIVIDDHLVITGSYNFSENAEANDENLLTIDSREVAAAYNRYFDALFSKYQH